MPAGWEVIVITTENLTQTLLSAVMSVQAIKGVEIGMGFGVSEIPGSKVHDEIEYSDDFHRLTTMPAVLRAVCQTASRLLLRRQ